MVYLRLAVCSCALLMLAGCGKSEPPLGNLVPVQGKITLTDGKPLPDGRLSFVAPHRDSNPTVTALIEADGSYTLSTRGQPGVPAGKYRVVLIRGEDRAAWSVVPKQYYSRQQTPLEVEVVENKPPGGYDLKVQSQAPSGARRARPKKDRPD